MPARNPLLAAPPYPVEAALKTLGANLRTARPRRNLTIEDVTAKIGVGRHVVAAAERGKASTGVAIHAGLLWVYGLTSQLEAVADPDSDEEGRRLARGRERLHARASKALDNDFQPGRRHGVLRLSDAARRDGRRHRRAV
jgi:transcriptional regulator with XRE-family HTH domain